MGSSDRKNSNVWAGTTWSGPVGASHSGSALDGSPVAFMTRLTGDSYLSLSSFTV